MTLKRLGPAVACLVLGFLLGVSVGPSMRALAGHGAWLNDFLRASAELFKAILWPVAALIIAYIYRVQIAELLIRLREFTGAKFDPPRQTQTLTEHPAASLESLAVAGAAVAVAGAGALPLDIERVRTAVVKKIEAMLDPIIGSYPALADPELRATALRTIAALAIKTGTFASIDSVIWASQLNLLQFLNGTSVGASKPQLKGAFYDPSCCCESGMVRQLRV
jgi:hypothetical protein